MQKNAGMSEATYKHISNNIHSLELDLEKGIILNRNTKATDDWGYYRVMLAGKVVKQHQVFAVYRWGKECIGMTVNHINGIKTDNSRANLELLTNEENISLNKGGGRGKPIKAINIHTGEELIYESRNEACRELGLAQTSVKRVLDGKYSHIKGYAFQPITA